MPLKLRCLPVCILLACLVWPQGAGAAVVDRRAAPGRVAINVAGEPIARFTQVAALPDGAVLGVVEARDETGALRPRVHVVKVRRDGRIDRRYGTGGAAPVDGVSSGLLAARDDGSAIVVVAATVVPTDDVGASSSVRSAWCGSMRTGAPTPGSARRAWWTFPGWWPAMPRRRSPRPATGRR